MSGKPYAEVIGDPIAHSKSPAIHNFWLENLGIEAEYRACHVRAEDLPDYFAQRRQDAQWRGCNLTIPHKEAAIPLLDTRTRNAEEIGAVNTVRRSEDGKLHGRNTDVHGIWRALDGVERKGRRILLIGAGGAARAAAFALRASDPAEIVIMNRSRDKAERLLAEFGLSGESCPLGPSPAVDLVVNASSLGMAGQPPLPVTLEHVVPGGAVFDMVYAPLETPLLREARTRGLHTVDGLAMLIAQAEQAFGVFFRAGADRRKNPELRALLTS